MKNRASGEIRESEAALSNLRRTGEAGWGSRQESMSEDKIILNLLRDLQHSPLNGGQDGVHYNSGVNSTYPNVDFPPPTPLSYLGYPNLPVNDASFQDQELDLGSYSALEIWDGSQRVSNSRHTLLATSTSQTSAAATAAAPIPASFPGPHDIQQNVQGQRHDFSDEPVNYHQPGPVSSHQGVVDPYGDDIFQPNSSFMWFNSDEDIHAPEATSLPEATPVPKAIPTANPSKKQKRKKKEEKRILPAVNVSNNNNNPASETPEDFFCHWLNCKHPEPFSKRHNLLQHRRRVHGEVIDIKKFRFGTPPPGDPTRRPQRLGKKRAQVTATTGAGEE